MRWVTDVPTCSGSGAASDLRWREAALHELVPWVVVQKYPSLLRLGSGGADEFNTNAFIVRLPIDTAAATRNSTGAPAFAPAPAPAPAQNESVCAAVH